MIILDTNVVSETMMKSPNPIVVRFLAEQNVRDLAVTSLTIFEIRFGLERLPLSAERRRLTILADGFDRGALGEVISLDAASAKRAAAFRADRQRAGRPVGVADSLIAGIVLRHGAALATRNIRDFDGADIELVDPWEGAAR